MSSPSPTEETSSSGPQSETRRPTGVTVFAILGIVFGVVGLLSNLGSLLMFFFRGSIPMPASPVDELLDTSFGYQVYYLATLGLGIVFSVILLVAGIGLLKMSPRARTQSIIYAIYAIPATIVTKVVDVLVMFSSSQTGEQSEEQQIIAFIFVGVAILFAFISLIFPVAILIYFSRPSVKQMFGRT